MNRPVNGPGARRLERLRADHEPAVLAFEQDNRTYFAASISDRGDAFFANYPQRHRDLLAEQDAGTSAFFVLVDPDGQVLGRFNLYELHDGVATVGYRIAEHLAGRGAATMAVRELCRTAASLGLTSLVAATAHANAASRRVLEKAGFTPTGPADPAELGGKAGTRYRRDLTAG